MKSAFLSTVAVLALTAGTAFAQATDTDTTTPIPVPGATSETMAPTGTDTGTSAETAQDAAPMEADGAADAETAQDAAPMEADGAAGAETAQEADPAVPAPTAGADTAMAADADTADRAGLYGTFADARVTDLIGMNVLSSAGDDIGEVDDLVHDGEVVKAVVGVGGFLGLGEHKVALPLADFTMGEDALQVGTMTREDLEALPEYADDAESLPLDTTVSGEAIATDELMTDPAASGTAAPSDG